VNGQTTQRWREILQELIANNGDRLTDRERRRVEDAVESVEHAGALRQLALDTAESCGRRSIPGSTSPFLQPDLANAFSKAASRSQLPAEEVAPTSLSPIQRNQSSIEALRKDNQAGARAAGPPVDQASAPPQTRPGQRPSRPG
jgi:hypothetical protein